MTTHNTPHQRRQAHRQLRGGSVMLAGAVVLLLAALAGTPAYAGEWMQVSCLNPNQSAAPSQGWSSFAGGGGYGSNNSTSCGPGNPMFAILSTDAGVAVGSDETLQYTPPGGSTLAGGSVDVSFYADGRGYDASGTAVAYTPEYAYNGSNVFFQCASGLPACANGTYDFSGVLDLPSGRGGDLYLSAGCGGGSGYWCDEGGSEGAWSLVRVWWANLLLTNDSTPAANNITGTLLTPDARGSDELVFTASDPAGPGVYEITAEAGGTVLYHGTPDNNGGQCSPVGESSGALMFDATQPCKQSESVDLQVNTTPLHDGAHALKVTIQDAAGNTSVVYDNTISTHNAPENTSLPAITTTTPTVGSTLSAATGEWSAPSGAGTVSYTYQWQDCDTNGENCHTIAGAQSPSYTLSPSDADHTLRVLVTSSDNDGKSTATSQPTSTIAAVQTEEPSGGGSQPLSSESTTSTGTNSPTSTVSGPSIGVAGFSTTSIGAANGTPASELAILHLNAPGTITRAYARRAFKLTGQLTNSQSTPIDGATLDVLQQTAGTTTLTLIAHTTTHSNGTFALTVPPGPSRTIEIAYRARSSDPTYAASARIYETVQATARLKITPSHTSPTGTIILSGHVQGAIPPQGTIVELLVHYRGHWEPFRDPRTNMHGAFRIAYQFQGAIGRFPFQAQIPAGQAGYPYAKGHSNIVHVSTTG